MANNTLAVLQSSLAIPGVSWGRRGLLFDEKPSEKTLEDMGDFLVAVEGSSLFWWGDFLIAAEDVRGEKYAEAMERSGYAYSSLRNAKWVCGKIPLSMRIDTLSFDHHQTALSECDGVASEAVQWLGRADAEGWPVKLMREKIRTARATRKDEDAGRPSANVSTDRAFEEFKRGFKPEKFTPGQRAAWRDDLRPIVSAWLSLFSPEEREDVLRELIE